MRALGLIAVLLLAFAVPAQAADANLLLKKYKCTMCHATDHRSTTAPSYDEIMKKYAGKADAPAHLAKVIREGSDEVWGMTHMSGNATIPDADVKAMVDWILKH